ncbi:MAG TPA: MlaD family protein [Solirubrobacteraceae bacterium]|nr:MlaD family protein [Solirubrobacteraceae bacterium]
METRSPSIGKVLTMVLFALSCVGLLLFLWLSFGGTIPFNPQGYRIQVAFPNAQELATQADVRIAGVSVGKVVSKSLDPRGNRTIATIQIDSKYAPIRQDAQAILREKTILGETYVQITPGSPHAPPIPDGGMLARSHVQHAVQLDEIFNAFDPNTRHSFQVWQQELATAVVGNDQNLSNVLGNLPTFAADASDILAVLNVEHSSVVRLIQNGGTVFGALGQNQAALRNLITTAEATFATTAANNNALATIFKVFPTFLNESKKTLARLKTFALNTDPLFKELVPVAQNLGPTLESVRQLSPNLRRFFFSLDPLITVSRTGLPATRDVINGATPLLGALGPFLEQLNPILIWLSLHQQLTSDFISNGATGIAAKTTVYGGAGLTCGGVPCGHYLRQFAPSGPETSAFYPTRNPPTDPSQNRGNTYPPPLWLSNPLAFSAGGKFPGNFALPAWDCGPGVGPQPVTGSAQACWIAPPLGPLVHQAQRFPHLVQATYSSR